MASGFSRKAAGVGEAGAGRHTISWRRRALWVVLALVPSTLLLGVTQHLATDVVSAPLLWVVPLALYLTTFIAAFSRRGLSATRATVGSLAPVAALLVLVLSLAEVRYPILLVALVHLAAFTVLAMLCHTRLAESRPDAAHLTEYFAWVSLGGVLGGAAAALVAPVVFSSILEYPLALAAALFLRPQTLEADRAATSRARRLAWRVSAALLLVAGYWCVSALNEQGTSSPLTTNASFAWLQSFTADVPIAIRASLAIPAALLLFTSRTALLFAALTAGLLVGAGVVRTGGDVLDRERTFFGVHQVTAIQNGDWHVLTHGTTTHGVQAVRGKLRSLPTAYYHPSGPLGDVVFTLVPDGRFRDVAAIGLGAGALAAYAGSGVRMDFFEIDDAVIRIAENPRYFTYLADARARPGVTVRTVAADGRLGLRAMPEASYDLDRRRRVFVGRDPDASHHPRGRGRVRVAPEVPWDDRFPRVEPVLRSAAGRRTNRRGSRARGLRAQRQGRAAGQGRAGDAAVRLGRPRARGGRLRPDRPIRGALGAARRER